MSPSLTDRLPKAELHIHVEAPLEPDMVLSLAERDGLDLPHRIGRIVRAASETDEAEDIALTGSGDRT